jgi:hypothetical protein
MKRGGTLDRKEVEEGPERNLRLYCVYIPLSRIYFFAPIFFLFFSSRFSIAQVLLLGTIYYLSVVLAELPSGYLSDRRVEWPSCASPRLP